MARPARRNPRDRKAVAQPASGAKASVPASHSKRDVLVWVVLLALAAGMVVWIHATRFFFQWTDEQIHLYVARRVSEGAVLYRDIESARPPLILFPATLLIKLGLSPLLAGRALVVASQFATAGLLFWGGWRLASLRAGGLAALLFLLSPEVATRIHYTGIQIVTLAVLACVLLSLRRRPFLAGLACGGALGAGQHAVVICGVAGAGLTTRRWRDGVWFVLGTLLATIVIFGGAWGLGGRNLWDNLVGRHLYHFKGNSPGNSEIWALFVPWLYEHMPLLLFCLAALTVPRKVKAIDSNPSPRWTVGFLLIAVAAHVAVTLSMAGGLFLYVVVVTPLLALLAGFGVDGMVEWFKRQSRLSAAQGRRTLRITLVLGTVAIALSGGAWAAARARQEHRDDSHYSFWPHIRHGEMGRLQKLDVANRVAVGLSALPKNRPLFGYPTIVSAVALAGGWRVAGELADLAPRWIEQGTVSREEITSRIERDGVAALVTPPWNLTRDPYFKAYLSSCYGPPTIFSPPSNQPGEGIPDILVFRHLDQASPCQVTMPSVSPRIPFAAHAGAQAPFDRPPFRPN